MFYIFTAKRDKMLKNYTNFNKKKKIYIKRERKKERGVSISSKIR